MWPGVSTAAGLLAVHLSFWNTSWFWVCLFFFGVFLWYLCFYFSMFGMFWNKVFLFKASSSLPYPWLLDIHWAWGRSRNGRCWTSSGSEGTVKWCGRTISLCRLPTDQAGRTALSFLVFKDGRDCLLHPIRYLTTRKQHQDKWRSV